MMKILNEAIHSTVTIRTKAEFSPDDIKSTKGH